jgi:hypothetical protein
MKPTWLSLITIACCLAFTGCAHRQPLISHAHVGHGLTHWTDTPDNKGLLQVAQEELETARREAEAALASSGNVDEKARHIANVSHALNPGTGGPQGPGLGYGAIRALEAAVEHLEYAATSDDASGNVVSSVASVSELGIAISARLRASNEKAQAARQRSRDPVALDQIALELRNSLRAAAVGADSDGNGSVDPTASEAGLEQLHAQLNAMLARETQPKYEPVPRRYLLGLVRMPDGKWVYTTIRKAMGRPSYGYGGGYGGGR